jgi:hypothetical protein
MGTKLAATKRPRRGVLQTGAADSGRGMCEEEPATVYLGTVGSRIGFLAIVSLPQHCSARPSSVTRWEVQCLAEMHDRAFPETQLRESSTVAMVGRPLAFGPFLEFSKTPSRLADFATDPGFRPSAVATASSGLIDRARTIKRRSSAKDRPPLVCTTIYFEPST